MTLQFSPLLNRLIRQDAPEKLGEPTRPLLETAVREGRTEEAKQWVAYYFRELATVRDIFAVWDWYMVRYYVEKKGDDSAWEDLLQKSMAPWLSATMGVRGQPFGRVYTDGRSARLTIPGLTGVLYLVEGDKRYDLTLGAPDRQKQEWANWHSDAYAAIDANNLDEVNRLLNVHFAEARLIHDVMCDWAWALLTVIAREWGEAILDEVLRVTEEPWVTPRYEKLRDMSSEEALRLTVEGMRGHLSGPGRVGTITVKEEDDRYVLSFDACGSGGRMRRGDPLVGSGSRLEPPYNFINIEGAYDWTWNRKGVCAYCAHCAVVNQILPIENLGRPMRLTEYPENANDPCRWTIYKDKDKFPDEAFTSVGKKREDKA